MMEVQDKYHYNERFYRYERIDHVQTYKGYEIATLTYYYDSLDPFHDRHREYKVVKPNGEVTYWPINKRGGNIKNLKDWIDFQNGRLKDYAVMFVEETTKKIRCDKFTAGSIPEAKHDFFECYRHGTYRILSVVVIN